MSPRYSQSAGDARPADGQPAAEEDGRSFTTGIGSMVGPADDETAPPPPPPPAPSSPAPSSPAPAQPTFTARADGPPEPAPAPDNTVPDTPAIGPDDGAADEPSVTPATDPVPAGDAVPGAGPVPSDGPVPGGGAMAADEDRTGARPAPAAADLDEPLLRDADGLRARWQRAQAGFVDNPQEAVGEAADLIEQTAQAMVGALRQRQRQLRVMWESGRAGGPVPGDSASRDGASSSAARGQDTEHLRQMMRHYRALFDQLCRS